MTKSDSGIAKSVCLALFQVQPSNPTLPTA